MIRVIEQPEPSNFDKKVRVPGNKFLLVNSKPIKNEWKGKEYWRKAIPELCISYKRMCAYCATKIPATTGEPTVDHYIPRVEDPTKAYEWTNFRLSSKRFNSKKHIKKIIDPFEVMPDWFTIDFDTYLIRPNRTPNVLTEDQFNIIEYTITALDLNTDDDIVTERIEYINDYIKGDLSFNQLKRWVPFIAYELERQNLTKLIKARNIG